jgi:hypothetical protein
VLIPDSYRELERIRGRPLREIGSAGFALGRLDALQALALLSGSLTGVLGGDVLKVTDGRLRYTYDNWFVKRIPDEDVMDFLTRSIVESDAYIRAYPDSEDGTVFYSLVISELGL